MKTIPVSKPWIDRHNRETVANIEEHYEDLGRMTLPKKLPLPTDYIQLQAHRKHLEEDAYGYYQDALEQIHRHISMHPRDHRWCVTVSMHPDLDEARLVELAKEFLHKRVEINIFGFHRMNYMGYKNVSCIVRD